MNIRILTPVVFLTLLPGIAAAQSADLEKACVNAAQIFLLNNNLKIGVIQSYPELTPPGVRFTYSEDADTDPADIDDQIDCEFERATTPFGISNFCVSGKCYSPSEQDEENRRRFQEVKTIMQRAK